MIGDRMDTDILCGLEAGLETILVLSGISGREDVERYPYRPSRIIDSVADLHRRGLTATRSSRGAVWQQRGLAAAPSGRGRSYAGSYESWQLRELAAKRRVAGGHQCAAARGQQRAQRRVAVAAPRSR